MRLQRIEPALRSALRRGCALPHGSRVLVAVSGGADSTALLIGLNRLASAFGLSLHAAHLHHGLRGKDADADLAHVRALCDANGIPLTTARWNAGLRMRRRGLSGQAGLRRLRREFLSNAARRAGCTRIATAHTADDQLETLLLRLRRGTGLPGLGGMHPKRGRWIKPLLDVPRAWIEDDLEAAGITWREDASNRDLRYRRNHVRHVAIPALLDSPATGGRAARRERAGMALKAARAALEAREATQVLNTWCREVLSGISRIQPGTIDVDSRRMATYPFALQRTVLRAIWAQASGPRPGLTHRHLEDLLGLVVNPRGGAWIELPGGWRASANRGMMRLHRQSADTAFRLRIPRGRTWAREGFESRWLAGRTALRRLPAKSRQEEYFAQDGLEGALELRPAGADEWFRPFGGARAMQLGAFLRKQKVSSESRSRPTVLSDASGILWVVGVRRSDRAPVTQSTHRVLWIHTERHD